MTFESIESVEIVGISRYYTYFCSMVNVKKIFPTDWLRWKPYDRADETDRYYTDVANRVLKIVCEDAPVDAFLFSTEYVEAAIRLTCWFEDICSNLGIWRVVNEECSKRYGAPVPFYDMGRYYRGEVNMADVKLILWAYLQHINPRGSLLNPENPAIERLAEKIADLYESEYEYAPENVRLYEFVHNPAIADDWMALRLWLNWFSLYSYVFIGQRDRLQEAIEDLREEEQDIPELIYSLQVNMVYNDKGNLLSLAPPKWCSRITGFKQIEKVEKYEASLYVYMGHTAECLTLKDVFTEKKYDVESTTLVHNGDILKDAKAGKSVFSADIATDGCRYYLSGIMVPAGDVDNPILKDELRKHQELEEAKAFNKQLYKDFVKANRGSQYAFVKDYDALLKYYSRKLGIDDAAISQIPPQLISAEDITLIGDPDNGICISPISARIIFHKSNRLYDWEYADENAIGAYVGSGFFPYKQACILHDDDMLPDARINSLKGEEYGRWFIRKHGAYLIDYFYNCCREYDF